MSLEIIHAILPRVWEASCAQPPPPSTPPPYARDAATPYPRAAQKIAPPQLRAPRQSRTRDTSSRRNPACLTDAHCADSYQHCVQGACVSACSDSDSGPALDEGDAHEQVFTPGKRHVLYKMSSATPQRPVWKSFTTFDHCVDAKRVREASCILSEESNDDPVATDLDVWCPPHQECVSAYDPSAKVYAAACATTAENCHWEPVGKGLEYIPVLGLTMWDGILVAAGLQGVTCYDGFGNGWFDINNGFQLPSGGNPNALDVTWWRGDLLAIAQTASEKRLMRMDAASMTWSSVASIPDGVLALLPQDHSPIASTLWLRGTFGVMRCEDTSEVASIDDAVLDWKSVACSTTNILAPTTALWSAQQAIFAGTPDDGVWQFGDGATTALPLAIPLQSITAGIVANDGLYVAGDDAVNMCTDNIDPITGTESLTCTGKTAQSGLPKSPTIFDFAEWRGDLYAATDNGVYVRDRYWRQWNSDKIGLGNPTYLNSAIVYALRPLEATLFAATSQGVYRYSCD